MAATTTPRPKISALRTGSPGYDAFLSYSHAADGRLAPALQAGLQSLAKPWHRRRALRVFRDKTSLSASPELWPAIEGALSEARYFVLLASPEAAASRWVDQEIRWWRAHRSHDTVLIALTDGELRWDDAARDFDAASAIPPGLRGWFPLEPLWVDLRWARDERDVSMRNPRFRDSVGELAAPLHGLPKDELIGEDISQHRRTLRLARGAVALLVLLLAVAIVGGVVALMQRNRALDQSRESRSRELAATAVSQLETDPALSLLLAAEAASQASTAQATTALRLALSASRTDAVLRMPSPALSPPDQSEDGRFVIQASADRIARVWDWGSRRVVASLRGHRDPEPGVPGVVTGGPQLSAAFGPDGKLAATAGDDGVVRVWNWPAERVLTTLRPGGGSPTAVSFSPDGRRLLVGIDGGSFEGRVLVYDWRSGAREAVLNVESPVQAIAVHPTGQRVAVALLGDLVRVLDLASGVTVAKLPSADSDAVLSAVDFSGDGRRVVTGDLDGTAEIWDARRQARLARLVGQGSLSSATFSPDGRLVATAQSDGRVRIWDWIAERALVQLAGHSGAVTGAIFGADGVVISGGTDRTIRRWRLQPELATLGNERAPVENVAPGAASDLVATGGISTTRSLGLTHVVAVWSAQDARELATVSEQPISIGDFAPLLPLELSPDNRLLAGAAAGRVHVWRWRRAREVAELKDPSQVTGDLGFSPDGRLLAATGLDRALRVWRWRDHRQLAVMRAAAPRDPDYRPGALDFVPGGDLVAAADGATVRIWDWRSRKQITRLSAAAGIGDVAVSPDGELVAVGRADGLTQIWDWRNDEVLAELRGSGRVVATEFGPDSQLVLTAESEGGTRVWDWTVEQRVAEFREPASPTTEFDPGTQDGSFSRGGRLVVTVGGDSLAHVYRCEVCAALPELRLLARRRATRGLTAAERRRYLHEDD